MDSSRDKDSRIALLTMPWVLIALLSVRKGTLAVEEFVIPTPIIVMFGAVAARYVYTHSTLSVVLGGLWLLGSVWFYIETWVPAMHEAESSRFSRVPILAVLGYIFYDYLRRNRPAWHRFLVGIALTVVFVFLTVTEVSTHRAEYELVVQLLRAAGLVLSAGVGLASWCRLSGREVQWLWRRRSPRSP